MKLRRQWFTPGRRITALRRVMTRSFFRRKAQVAVAGDIRRGGGWLPATAENVGAIFSILISVVLIAAIIALLYAFVREVRRDTLEIGTISAPRAITERGYTDAVIAGAVLQEFKTIQSSASTTRAKRDLESGSRTPDIQVAGAGLSMKSIVRYARALLGFPEHSIDGEILQRGMGLRLLLHVRDGKTLQSTAVDQADGDVDALLREGGRALVQVADPYVLASYLHDQEKASGHFTQTLAAVDYVLANPPENDDAWALNLLGIVRGEEGDYTAALAAFRRAISADPQLSVVGGNYIGALLHAGKDAEAAQYLQQRAAMAHTASDWTQILFLNLAMGDYRGIFEAQRRILALDPRNEVGLKWGPIALFFMHRPQEALALSENNVKLYPDSIDLITNRSAALAATGRTDEGLAIAQSMLSAAEASKKQQFIAITRWLRGFVRYYQGRYVDALDDFRTAAALGDDDPILYDMTGRTLLALKRPDEAVTAYRRATEVSTNDWQAYTGLAQAELARGHVDESVRLFGLAAKGNADDPELYAGWATALDLQGHASEAAAKRAEGQRAQLRLQVPLAGA